MTTAEMIASIDTQLASIIANPEVDFTVGGVKISASQKTKQLLEIKAQLLSQPDAEIADLAFDFDIDPFGGDNSQYEGDGI